MNKKNFLIIASLAVISLLMASLYFLFFRLQTEKLPAGQEPGGVTSDFDLTQCDKYSDELIRQKCLEIKDLAAIDNLIDRCHGYTTDETLFQSCFAANGVYSGAQKFIIQATYSHDVELCFKVAQPDRDTCLRIVAINNQDQKICDQISNQSEKDFCQVSIVIANGDFEQCAQDLSANLVSFCQQEISTQHNSLDFCQSLKNSNDQEKCLEFYYTKSAILSEDYSVCDKITLAGGKDRCLIQLPPDTDGDGLSDNRENYRLRTDPTKADTDGDGLTDYDEVQIYKTSPLEVDTDLDGFSDGEEVAAGHDPLQP